MTNRRWILLAEDNANDADLDTLREVRTFWMSINEPAPEVPAPEARAPRALTPQPLATTA